MLLNLVLILAGIYGFLCLALYLGQHRLVWFPDPHLVATPADRGLPYSDQWITTADGVRLHAWYVPGPPDAPVVLFFHGNAGNLSHRLETLELLSRLGAGVLILSYRGYGASGGTPDEHGTYLDAAAAHGHLTGTLGVPGQRLIVFGRSLGAAVASRLAAEHECGALIVESAFTSVPDLAAGIYPAFPVRLLARIRYDTRAHLARARCPVLVIHGRADEVVPFAHGERLQAAAPPGTPPLLEIPGGHNAGLMLRDPGYAAALGQIVSRLRERR